jgi:hypothetical protein
MKKCLGILLFGLAVVFQSSGAPTSAEQLRSEFEKALNEKDTNAVLTLVNWKGVGVEMKSEVTDAMADTVGSTVTNVTLLTLSKDYQATNEVNGIRYFPNVWVKGMIDVEFKGKKIGNTEIPNEQIPYGESDGRFYIAGTIQETFDAHATKSTSLAIAIYGYFSHDNPGIFTCSYVYASPGGEKPGGFDCTNNWSESFWGDFIKSCKVTKISGSGSYKLLIHEGEKIIFDSGLVKTNDSVSYEKKDHDL